MSPPKNPPISSPLLVDVHVHFYPRYAPDRFFEAASSNLRRGAAQVGIQGAWNGCLIMTEGKGHHQFANFRSRIGHRAAGIEFEATEEEHSLTVRLERPGASIWVIAGRQIQTSEGLEILAFPASDTFPDGLSAERALERIREASATAVIPWGFGKWWLRRGSRLNRLIETNEVSSFFLADSAHRIERGLRPRAFSVAETRGIPVLAGSDPLPILGEETRAGSFGSQLEGPADPMAPAKSLSESLRVLRKNPPIFGSRVKPLRFLHCQAAVRLGRRGSDR